VFSVGAAQKLYNEDLRQLRGELREYLETAGEDDFGDMAKSSVQSGSTE
jgi:hypothetical protein